MSPTPTKKKAATANKKGQPKKKPAKKKEEQAVAGYLLSLKHSRSVSPEPGATEGSGEAAPEKQPPPVDGNQLQAQLAHSIANFMNAPGTDNAKEQAEEAVKDPAVVAALATVPMAEVNFEALIQGSTLVHMKDRDLVPDALFVAMAQLKVCKLTQSDRVGCYKARELGFVGMCCKHCGGQPGFGRYFPNSVRSLAQTTTSQTILKHMGSKCRFCTPEVRNAILELQRQQAAREGLSSGRPRYGSRKIFFQRVWARLHGGVNIEDEFKDSEDAHVPLAQPEDAKLPAIEEPPKRKTRGGASNKNKKAKIEAEATNQVEV